MRKNKPKPVPHLHPNNVPKASVAQPRPCWHAAAGVQLSLYDIPDIQAIHIRGAVQ